MDAQSSRGRHQESFGAVSVTTCFAGGSTQGTSYFPDHIVDGYLSVVEGRKPPFYPYAWHRRILQLDQCNVASLHFKWA